jgi:putative redox protein
MALVTVRLDKGLRAVATARHHTWVADEPVQDGGTDEGPKPTEMLLASLGACVAMTARLYAQRKGWPLEAVEVVLDYKKFNGIDYPAYTGSAPFVHEFRERLVLHGPLTDEQRARIAEIARKCPVRRILENPVFFVEAHPVSDSALSDRS